MSNLPGTVVHRKNYNGLLIEIRDQGDLRTLYFDGQYLQSSMSLSDPVRLVLSYTQIMAFSLLLTRKLERLLVIGVGAGSLVRFFHHHFPECRIDAVDISERVLDLARGWFGLPENGRVKIYCEDGAKFLENSKNISYDLILLDAYDGQGMSPSIYTPQFLYNTSCILSDSGLVTANIWTGDTDYFAAIKTDYATTFDEQLFLPVPDRGNIVVTAMNDLVPWSLLDRYSSKSLTALGKRYRIDFKQIAKLARQNNLSLSRRVARLFQARS